MKMVTLLCLMWTLNLHGIFVAMDISLKHQQVRITSLQNIWRFENEHINKQCYQKSGVSFPSKAKLSSFTPELVA